ncbi:DUF2550 family protein [Cellulomonas bogoriensis]|uniref:DUF2550 family protein n=1 Tax=Cellulomonas bogoriensis TaxID=301388 RepID=UPI000557713E|nr:DUF2550 family protein [Cellulomonas bogoriensis]
MTSVVLGGLTAVLLVAVVVLAGLYLSRLRTLSRRVGSFACGVRHEDRWTAGIAQYTHGRIAWWRAVSLAPRPARTWSRGELTLLERTPLGEQDEHGQEMLLVRCLHGGETFDLAMSVPACAGLVSWLESGPRPIGRVI